MSYTYTEQKGDGSARTFPFSFAGEDKGYIKATDILVETAVTGQDYQTTTGWSLSGTNQITFLTAPANGLNIRIRRVVDKTKPFAKFDRSVTLDMLSLNNTFVQTLQVIQEIMDGFFPANFFFKGNINLGGHRVVNMSPAVDNMDAINKGQFDVEVARNNRQDQDILTLFGSLTTGTAHRTVPWYYVATGGETKLTPPMQFTGAVLFINRLLQSELGGDYSIKGNEITLSNPLSAYDKVYALLGSRMAPPANDEYKEVTFAAKEGDTLFTLPEEGGRYAVYLDGLRQPLSAYTIVAKTLTFTEALPVCAVTVEYLPLP